MISVKDELPKEGEVVRCQVNFWHYGAIHHTEILEAEYIGMNDITGHPMFEIETGDMAYPEVTHWERLANNACSGQETGAAKSDGESNPAVSCH